MKESYGEGPATHTGPESCVGVRKGDGETLTGGRAGRVFSRERHSLQSADAVRRSGRRYPTRRQRKTWRGAARAEAPSMGGETLRENRGGPGGAGGGGAGGGGGGGTGTSGRWTGRGGRGGAGGRGDVART